MMKSFNSGIPDLRTARLGKSWSANLDLPCMLWCRGKDNFRGKLGSSGQNEYDVFLQRHWKPASLRPIILASVSQDRSALVFSIEVQGEAGINSSQAGKQCSEVTPFWQRKDTLSEKPARLAYYFTCNTILDLCTMFRFLQLLVPYLPEVKSSGWWFALRIS